MSFNYRRTIYLRETDATGVLYFPEQFKLALEAFEAFLISAGFHLTNMIDTMDFLMPVVHAEANYSAPMRAGDVIEIHLSLKKMGDSSFTLSSLIFDAHKKQIGDVSIIHATVSKKAYRSIPLPTMLKGYLQKLHE